MKQRQDQQDFSKDELKRASMQYGAMIGILAVTITPVARNLMSDWLSHYAIPADSPEHSAWMTASGFSAMILLLLTLNPVRLLIARFIIKSWRSFGPTPSLWFLAVFVCAAGCGTWCWRLGSEVDFIAPASLYYAIVGGMFGVAAAMLLLLPVHHAERQKSAFNAHHRTESNTISPSPQPTHNPGE